MSRYKPRHKRRSKRRSAPYLGRAGAPSEFGLNLVDLLRAIINFYLPGAVTLGAVRFDVEGER